MPNIQRTATTTKKATKKEKKRRSIPLTGPPVQSQDAKSAKGDATGDWGLVRQ